MVDTPNKSDWCVFGEFLWYHLLIYAPWAQGPHASRLRVDTDHVKGLYDKIGIIWWLTNMLA
jgi:hypothetical protein